MKNRSVSAGTKANWRAGCFALALAAAVGFSSRTMAADAGNWIGSWAASPQPVWTADFPVPLGIPANLWKQTIRQTARLSIGGSRVRIVLSNEYGKTPLTIGAAEIALAGEGGKIKDGSAHAVTFGGNPTVVIPPGAPAISDPVDMSVDPLALVSVSLYLPEVTPLTTIHWDGHQTAYVGAGNQAAGVEFKADSKLTQRAFLSEILVDAPAGARAVVAFGDSITDGDGSTVDGNDRWPDRLAERLAKAGGPPVAVLNEGISGAKILSDRMGVNALARFDADVLSQPKADTVILMMGINDVGWPGCGLALHDPEPTAEAIIEGYKQLIARAHAHGLRIIGATLTPFGDAFAGTPFEGYYTPEKEKIRVALNDFIRSGAFDGVIDFDKVIVDPQKPGYTLPKYGKGDNLHPNAAGYKAMGDAIDLNTMTTN
ncbi:MAG TPA: SGNH/GDSL hydrolase family protein [Roseiarcus sp.]|jgi:lysophospholipase L1-like esterase|nr:SGNH/GDSL hydrolase family protein [Roseiarcus sp.]